MPSQRSISILDTPLQMSRKNAGIRGPAPDFELYSFNGETISSSVLKGKVIVLEFWDTRCGPCRRLMLEMEKLYLKYKDNPEVAILEVNAGWETKENAQKFISNQDYELN